MNRFDWDLFVIGGGSGGVRAARIAAQHGAKVAICEEYRYGGTCVIRGCVPKKFLVYASHFAEEFEDSEAYGWRIGEPRFDWPTLINNKDKEIDRLNRIYIDLLETAGVSVLQGRGRFLDAHTVEVDGTPYRAEKILIATGGHPFMPDTPGIEHAISSNEAFYLPRRPDSALVAGGGYIAVEFAGIFNGLGANTTLLYRRDLILRGFDDDVRAHLAAEMSKKGVEIRYGQVISRIELRDDGRRRVVLDDDSELAVDQVLFAVGRRPNTGDLGLDLAGVEQGPIGEVPVNEFSQTNVEHIFAVGDVTNRIALTPVATMEGHCFADTEFGGARRRPDHENVPSAVFSQPPVATVGLTEAQARERFAEVEVYRSEFRALKHTLTENPERTFMKLLVDAASDRVVGAHMVGADAAEIVQGVAIAIKAGARKSDFDATVGIHPTSAEEFVTLRTKS